MKIKTQENLTDFLNKELSWRKKELFTLFDNVKKNSGSKFQDTALRAGIVLLYAHWEGFIKCASEAYLEYVISKRLKYKDLDFCFVAIAAKQKIYEFNQTNKSTIHKQFVEFLLCEQNNKAIINKENIIKTQSNLNSDILKEMMTSIGLDYTEYETKSNLIDEQLLKHRNDVAHGQRIGFDLKDYLTLHEEVKKMLEKFKTDIENAAILFKYKRK